MDDQLSLFDKREEAANEDGCKKNSAACGIEKSEAARRIKELTDALNHHSYMYHVLDKPEITDYDYDMLFKELETLETEYPELAQDDSPMKRVGGIPLASFEKTEHAVPMQSLNDIFSEAEVLSFVNDLTDKYGSDTEFVVEHKIDGLSVSILYEDGKLVRGVTRGNGTVGENVTENIKTVRAVPLMLRQKPELIEVRGEIYISKKDFAKINQEQEEDGQTAFANPRNAAAGSLRQLDSTVAARRRLNIFVFNIQRNSGIGRDIKTHSEGLQYLEELGFKTIHGYRVCHTAQEVWKAICDIGEERSKLAYDIDGAVIKVNSLELREKIGVTSRAPKWAAAYKYPPERQTTRIIDIVIQVGRTGVLTPNAVFEPVKIAGSTISRATLHNADYIKEKDIRIGDTVWVQKAGDVIPEVIEVDMSKRAENAEPYIFPDKCPVCGSEAVRKDDEAAVRCSATDCPAKLYRSILHFVQRDAMNIDGMGDALAALLIDKGFITGVADLYRLHERRSEIAQMERMGEKSTSNLLEAIENSKTAGMDRLLYGLGIRNVGKRTAKIAAERFGSLERLAEATEEELAAVDEIGPTIAYNIANFFAQKKNMETVNELRAAGIKTAYDEVIRGGIFNGMTAVVTGTLEAYTRNDVAELIESLGGKVSGSVSKKTTFVLCGEDSGSKRTKAESLGIRIIEEEEFLKMLKEADGNASPNADGNTDKAADNQK